AKRQRGPPLGTNLHGDLVGRTADPPRLHLEERPGVLHRPLQGDRGVVGGSLADDLQRLVHRALRQALLAVQEDLVDQLGDQHVLVDGVRLRLTASGRTLARHARPPPYAPALAPYRDLAFFRSRTPAVSSVPRMILYRTPGRSFTRP